MSLSVSIPLPFIDSQQSEKSITLFQLLIEAHQQAAIHNNNASKVAGQIAMQGSGSFVQAICASLMTIGAHHAPIREARRTLLHATKEDIHHALDRGEKIAGFGNSFFKDHMDPAFQPVMDFLTLHYKDLAKRIADLQALLWTAGKHVYPNAALLTAAVCEVVGVPQGIEETLFVLARLPVWASDALFIQNS